MTLARCKLGLAVVVGPEPALLGAVIGTEGRGSWAAWLGTKADQKMIHVIAVSLAY